MIVEPFHLLSLKFELASISVHILKMIPEITPVLDGALAPHEYIRQEYMNTITKARSQSTVEKKVSGIAIQEIYRTLID